MPNVIKVKYQKLEDYGQYLKIFDDVIPKDTRALPLKQ